MQNTRFHIYAVTRTHNLRFTVRRELEHTTRYISRLRMRMCMRRSDCSSLELDFEQHQVVVKTQKLPNDT